MRRFPWLQTWTLSALLTVPLMAQVARPTSVLADPVSKSGSDRGQAPSPNSRQALETFLRQLDRAEDLYRALMFEEADRVSDLTVMRINAFLEEHRYLGGIDELEAVMQARTAQLRELRSLLEYDRKLEEQRSAARYDRLKPERERKEKERRDHAYRMAVERRRAAEARAASWWPLWFGRPLIILR